MFQIEALFDAYGIWDYVVYKYGRYDDNDTGYYRSRAYYDGGWLEGYDLEPVVYWGA